jgi:hypothetical protein
MISIFNEQRTRLPGRDCLESVMIELKVHFFQVNSGYGAGHAVDFVRTFQYTFLIREVDAAFGFKGRMNFCVCLSTFREERL